MSVEEAVRRAAARAPLSLSFPGAGVLLYWQLGVLYGLSQRYDMARVPLLGSSSGAVATALAASGACLKGAAETATELFSEQHRASRPFGLVGVLGRLVGKWLHETLPPDAADRCNRRRATLLVTTLPFFQTRPISEFTSRSDLIKVVMASAHIPLVVDWRMFVRCKGSACVDGGLWWLLQNSLKEYQHQAAQQTLVIKPEDDPGLQGLMAQRHSILAKPSGGRVVSEMWERGVEHSRRIGEVHYEKFKHLQLLVPRPLSWPSGSVAAATSAAASAVTAAAEGGVAAGGRGSALIV